MKIAILGFGLEGKALLKFIRESPVYKNAEVWILDRNTNIKKFGLPQLKGQASIKFQTGKNYLKNLERFDIVFRSPGVSYNLPEIQRAIKKGVEFSSATNIFFQKIRGLTQINARINADKYSNIKIIGITGTKGKGTTSTLLYKILKACPKLKRKVFLAGNIGKPAIEILPKLKKNSIVILELSSFQLQDFNLPAGGPDIAVIADIFPDHLDAHKNFREYLDAKSNIAKWQSASRRKNDKIFYFSDNKYCRWIAQKSPAKKIPVQCQNIGCPDIEKIFGASDVKKLIKIPGFHNIRNTVMAANVALSLKCPKNKILNAIKNFKGNEHRLELVGKINGISFYNDSASTNPQTAVAAIKSFSEPKILIAGGKDKNLNYSPLAKALKNSNVKLAILFGENKKKIAKEIFRIKNKELRIMEVKNLDTAVKTAYKTAKFLIHNSKFIIHIIFSPASASFDMFKNYKERGEKFKKIVKKLK